MSRRLWISTRKGLFRAEHSADGWELRNPPAFLGSPVSAALEDPRDGMLYAALSLGHFGVNLHRSEDLGTTWTELGAPSYAFAADPDGGEEALAKAPALELAWSLEPGGADEPGVLWCGTIPGGLFRSEDRGKTWAANRALWDRPERARWFGGGFDKPGIHSILVDPRDSQHVTVGVSCGGVWTSHDAGASWEIRTAGMYADYMPPEQREDPAIQDPHRLVACAADPDALWVQHHNGIFRSRDGGRLWRDCPRARPSAFGFAVAVHPEDPNVAWFVPGIKDEYRVPVDARFVVSRTRDGGDSFETLERGLPHRAAYDLVYRHALDVHADGETLGLASTTGNLWVSENGGDQWSALSHHLPPVYAVRFAA